MKQEELNTRALLDKLIKQLSGRMGKESRTLQRPIQRSPTPWDAVGGAGVVTMLTVASGTGGTSTVRLFTIGRDGFEAHESWQLG